jgi:twinkle protein
VKSWRDPDGNVKEHYYPYTKNGQIVAYKERVCDGKKFMTQGDFKDVELFGQSLFAPGGRKLVITEGEIDALSVATACQKGSTIWPVVSVPNGAASGAKAVLANLDYIRSFDEVILMMDNDEPGKKAENALAKVIGADKVKIAKLSYKDASDALMAGATREIQSQQWNAQPWCPAGIINSKDTWAAYIGEKDAVYIPYPDFCPDLNANVFGRRMGSITMITSGTGSGKSSFLREDMHHLLKTTDAQIGICSLEESIAETTRGIMSIEISKRLGLPTTEVTDEEERSAWESTMGTGRFELLDHQGSVGDGSLMEKLRYLAVTCDFIYLDHITIAVSETGDVGVNAAMDAFMSDLLKLCKSHDVWIGVVSHLRKVGQGQKSFEEGGAISEDDLKGSGSLKQIAAQTISLTRNKVAEDVNERNTVKITVLKDRFSGFTGPSGGYKFDAKTGRLKPAEFSAPIIPFGVVS